MQYITQSYITNHKATYIQTNSSYHGTICIRDEYINELIQPEYNGARKVSRKVSRKGSRLCQKSIRASRASTTPTYTIYLIPLAAYAFTIHISYLVCMSCILIPGTWYYIRYDTLTGTPTIPSWIAVISPMAIRNGPKSQQIPFSDLLTSLSYNISWLLNWDDAIRTLRRHGPMSHNSPVCPIWFARTCGLFAVAPDMR